MNARMLGLLMAAMLGVSAAQAQTDAIHSEYSAALHDALEAQQVGPAAIELAGQAVLQLPPEFVYVPMPAAARMVRALGNTPDPDLVGIIFPGRQENWMIAIQYANTGHIRDDDARLWDVDQLLRSVSDGTDRGNDERRRYGFHEIEVLGWAEKPRYDSTNHRLVWAVAARDKDAPSNSDQGINYNTYALGREGYFKLNLVTDLKDLQRQKPAADAILASLEYLQGKRYADFNPATDRVADFGLTSLVIGIAARKVGVNDQGHAELLVISMVIVLLLLAAAGGWWWWRRRRNKSTVPSSIPTRDDFPPTEIRTLVMTPEALGEADTIPRQEWAAPAPSAKPADAPASEEPAATAAASALAPAAPAASAAAATAPANSPVGSGEAPSV